MRLVIFGFVALLALGIAVSVMESNAEASARAFCERFPAGSPIADAQAAARDTGDARHRFIRAEDVSVAFVGLPPYSRHMCRIEGAAGKVTAARYFHLD